MEIRLKGINKVKKKLADGSIKEYHYAWKGKGAPLLPGKPNSDEYIEAYFAARRRTVPVVHKDTLLHLFQEYEDSFEYSDDHLAETTKKGYGRIIAELKQTFGKMPKAALLDPATRGVFKKWRSKNAKDSLSQAQKKWDVLALILAWGVDNGIVRANPCAKGGQVYKPGARRNKFWTSEHKERFRERGPANLYLAVLLADWLGQRESDLIKLLWDDYVGEYLYLVQKKTGLPMALPVPPLVKAALESAPRIAKTILVNHWNRPWETAQSFSSVFSIARVNAGIEGVTFHDLRRTAVREFALSGCTEYEIASITGHSVSEVKAVLRDCYVNFQDIELRQNAMRKRVERLERGRSGPKRDWSKLDPLERLDRMERLLDRLEQQTAQQTEIRVLPPRRNLSFEDQWVR